ncbi:hypothetical protein QPX11_11225 [Corynebacterium propinquum]|uniref:hypothetical protein n=1 Tax=Corynebacterium propinquum TaxID=43769 RepID=UPI002542B63E|nr:hypothetical protein [Corynebacterium propinquum]MDK4252878.1 hypothetical protein [Corynebacterium propinquum]
MTTTEDFNRLYPDIDPNTGFPLSVMEKMALSFSTGIIAFGVVTAEVIIAALGLVLIIVTALIVAQKTARRVRNEARTRFPGVDWVEFRKARDLNLGLYIPLTWAIIIAASLAGFWWIPADYAVVGGIIIGIFSAALLWFMPGLSPLWGNSKRSGDDNARYQKPSFFHKNKKVTALQDARQPAVNHHTEQFPAVN